MLPRFFLSLFFLFFLLIVSTPSVSAAGVVPCGRSSGTADEMAPCTVCHLVVGGQGLIQWGLGIMTVIAITVMMAMAVLYIVATGNEHLMETAKGGIIAALIGFAVMLSAWLIVNVILMLLANTDSGPLAGLRSNGAFVFSCDTKSNVNPGSTPTP